VVNSLTALLVCYMSSHKQDPTFHPPSQLLIIKTILNIKAASAMADVVLKVLPSRFYECFVMGYKYKR